LIGRRLYRSQTATCSTGQAAKWQPFTDTGFALFCEQILLAAAATAELSQNGKIKGLRPFLNAQKGWF
jgi:hypothetical protein